MSHRDDCMSRREAERRGERDYEYRGYRSYSAPDEIRGCPEAERAYQDGQRYAEYRAEEEAAEQRAAERRRQEREYQEQQYQEYQESYYEQMQEQDENYLLEIDAAVAEAWGNGP